MPEPLQFLIGFCINLMMTLIIVRFIYFPATQSRKHVLTLIGFNSMIFFMMAVLTTLDIGLGTGFGLFALLSLLRYRSEAVSARDMTYLFVLIGLSVVNAVTLVSRSGFSTLLVGNICIITLLYILEQGWGFSEASPKFLQSKRIVYPLGSLIKPEHEKQLLDTLRRQTGLAITKIDVGQINFIKGSAELIVHYNASESVPSEPIDNVLNGLNNLNETTLSVDAPLYREY